MTFYRGDPDRNWPVGMSRLPVDYRPEGSAKFASTADGAGSVYNENVEITKYYANASGTELVRIEERIRVDEYNIGLWAQTISGSNYSQQWPNYNHYIVYKSWSYTTYSG